MKNSTLGERMKQYEFQYSSQRLLNLLPVIVRLDGKCFHSFTKGLKRPFDERLHNLMVETTKFLVKETNAKIGYCQSDEISLILHNEDYKSELFFDNRLLKMTSILASMCTLFFNKYLQKFIPEKANKSPLFDCRCFNVPNLKEAINYLWWREIDATRNSISMAAQSFFSHNQLMNKNSSEMQEMMYKKFGINWNDYPTCQKRGSYIAKRKIMKKFTENEIEKLPLKHAARTNSDLEVSRSSIDVIDLPPLKKIANKIEVIFYDENVKYFI